MQPYNVQLFWPEEGLISFKYRPNVHEDNLVSLIWFLLSSRGVFLFYLFIVLIFCLCLIMSIVLHSVHFLLNLPPHFFLFLFLFQVHLQTQQQVTQRLSSMAVHVVRTQGVLALYNGLSASLMRQVLKYIYYVALVCWWYNVCSDWLIVTEL